MRALVYTGPEQIEFTDVPDPEPKSDEVVIKIDESQKF